MPRKNLYYIGICQGKKRKKWSQVIRKWLQTSHFYYVPQKSRLQDFSLHKTKGAFKDIQLPAQSQNSPAKLVVWSFCAQSTVPPLHSSLESTMSFMKLQACAASTKGRPKSNKFKNVWAKRGRQSSSDHIHISRMSNIESNDSQNGAL